MSRREAEQLLDFITPDDLARSTGWSPRRVRELARGLGACRILGNRMVLTPADVRAILEASRPCPSKCTVAAKSGTTAGPLRAGKHRLYHPACAHPAENVKRD